MIIDNPFPEFPSALLCRYCCFVWQVDIPTAVIEKYRRSWRRTGASTLSLEQVRAIMPVQKMSVLSRMKEAQ